jgi:signal transduction histidine kinase
MYLEWDIEWEISMVVAISTVLLIGFILGGSTVYLVENHLRAKEMNKIYKLTESLINGNELDGSDIGKETLYSKTTNQLIRLQEMLEGRRKEAEKSQYEIQKLISEIAHQLRTPLSNIKNYTELLQESLNETQEVLNAEYMKDLRTSEEQLCFLVESFIKTARLEQGIIQVHTQKENLVETILNALGQIQKKAEEKGIFFQVELPEKIICEHDKNWMCEAFYNVFDNAVKYSKNNSMINITMKQTEMFYKIQVRDYGIGVRDGEENKIFQRFYRFYRRRLGGSYSLTAGELAIGRISDLVPLCPANLFPFNRHGLCFRRFQRENDCFLWFRDGLSVSHVI